MKHKTQKEAVRTTIWVMTRTMVTVVVTDVIPRRVSNPASPKILWLAYSISGTVGSATAIILVPAQDFPPLAV